MNQSYLLNDTPTSPQQFNQTALNPALSVVVRACAGSGKTWLLTARIIRLLLAGVEPRKVLAITFTKKAAQEMRDRVAQLLLEMAQADEATVLQLLIERGLTLSQAQSYLPRARALYDEVLGSGQELPIFTFDAWFYRLLKAAPMRLLALRSAQLLTDADELRQLSWQNFFDQFNAKNGAVLRGHYLALIERIGQFNTHKLCHSAFDKSNEFALWLRQNDDVLAALRAQILAESGFDVSQGASGVLAAWYTEVCSGDALSMQINALLTDKKKAERGQALQNAWDSGEAQVLWDALLPYITKDNTLSKKSFSLNESQRKILSGVWTGDVQTVFDEALDQLNQVYDAHAKRAADLKAYELHTHIFPVVQALLAIYEADKQRAQVVEFGDVTRYCFELLNDEDTAAYMQTQLDARYQHLLFDEFQDTNPMQWHIIRSWLAAYQGANEKPQVFLVGDIKQSIYRFRGADARLFGQAQELLCSDFNAQVLQTQYTRRNSAAVIAWVNAMFTQQDSVLDDFVAHSTANTDVGHIACLGLIELSDENAANSETESEPIEARNWLTTAKEQVQKTRYDDESAQLVFAIEQLVGHYPVRDEDSGQYRPARYSDVMLLVYGRTHLGNYERLLREAHIPFESSRRGGLLDTLEALDVMALLQWLIRPDDNLALMQVLRNPIFATTEPQLHQIIAHRQAGLSDWQVLQQLSSSNADAHWHKVQQMLATWLQFAHHLPPHDVLDAIYAQGNIYAAYARVVPTWMNAQVQANLQGFLQLALNVNAGRYPSLSRLLQALKRWQKAGQKNANNGQSEQEPLGLRDAVRILTVHAAKGLEAPIVMLLDMRTGRDKSRSGQWLIDWQPNACAPAHISWLASQEYLGQWRSERLRQDEFLNAKEQQHKCYVAMTRARQLLLVSAAQELDIVDDEHSTQNSTRTQSKSKMNGIFESLMSAIHAIENQEIVLPAQPETWQAQQPAWSRAYTIRANVMTTDKPIVNHYQDITDAQAVNLPTPLVSNHYGDLGTALHAALQYATDTHTSIDVDWLMRRCALNTIDAQTVLNQTQTILSAAHNHPWFDANQYDEAHNEMSIVTAQGDIKRIDRWVRCGALITVLDYKTSWREDNLAQYEQQVREYMHLLGALYPECRVQGCLLRADGRQHLIAEGAIDT